jgi:hypothetical protein
MTNTLVLNAVLGLALFVIIVGGLAWAVWGGRRARQPLQRGAAETHQHAAHLPRRQLKPALGSAKSSTREIAATRNTRSAA